jgi:hypothetical protein
MVFRAFFIARGRIFTSKSMTVRRKIQIPTAKPLIPWTEMKKAIFRIRHSCLERRYRRKNLIGDSKIHRTFSCAGRNDSPILFSPRRAMAKNSRQDKNMISIQRILRRNPAYR